MHNFRGVLPNCLLCRNHAAHMRPPASPGQHHKELYPGASQAEERPGHFGRAAIPTPTSTTRVIYNSVVYRRLRCSEYHVPALAAGILHAHMGHNDFRCCRRLQKYEIHVRRASSRRGAFLRLPRSPCRRGAQSSRYA